MAFTFVVPSKPILDQLAAKLGLSPAVYTASQYPRGCCFVVGARVTLRQTARVPYLYYEAVGATVAQAEQNAAIITLHALAAEYHVELKGINYPQVFMLHKEVAQLQERVYEAETLCRELLEALRTSDGELSFMECLSHRFYRRVRALRDTVAALQQGVLVVDVTC